MDDVEAIRCVGGPLDGRMVEVDARGGRVTREFYILALVDGEPVAADDPEAHNRVAVQVALGGSGWTAYMRAEGQEAGVIPVYDVLR